MGEELFSSAASPDPFIGRILDGRYEVLARLGTGGVGVVYRGKQVQLGRFVAIKMLQQHTADVGMAAAFPAGGEGAIGAGPPEHRQRHGFRDRRGAPYLVMELLEGKTLADLLEEGRLPFARALDIARQMLRGLAFAHSKGIVHRDLKPANVFLQALPDHADHVRLLDFGMAKFLEGSGSPTLGREPDTHRDGVRHALIHVTRASQGRNG